MVIHGQEYLCFIICFSWTFCVLDKDICIFMDFCRFFLYRLYSILYGLENCSALSITAQFRSQCLILQFINCSEPFLAGRVQSCLNFMLYFSFLRKFCEMATTAQKPLFFSKMWGFLNSVN